MAKLNSTNRSYWVIIVLLLLVLLIFALLWYKSSSENRKSLDSLQKYQDLSEIYFDGFSKNRSYEEILASIDSLLIVYHDDSNLIINRNYIIDNANSMYESESLSNAIDTKSESIPSDRNKEFLNRITTLSAEYQKLLKSNLVLTDSILRLRSENQMKDLRFDSLRYVYNSVNDSLKDAIDIYRKKDEQKLIKFKSPAGVDIHYIGYVNKDQKASGYGIGVYSNGNIYEGQWKNGKKQGSGLYKFSDGEYYEGDFVDDKRQGFGKYVRKNGEYYKGYWAADFREGEGVIYDKNGNIQKSGIWKQDKLITEKKVAF
jgi:hypothetical protein